MARGFVGLSLQPWNGFLKLVSTLLSKERQLKSQGYGSEAVSVFLVFIFSRAQDMGPGKHQLTVTYCDSAGQVGLKVFFFRKKN